MSFVADVEIAAGAPIIEDAAVTALNNSRSFAGVRHHRRELRLKQSRPPRRSFFSHI